ncbi:hypothetical protein HJC23_008075 [Cyclotella cryptica]|uniref:GMP phosphodiesterase delta subunit domain-containing protein n=1 Tax=Cyclotella cryptica TaxID=29204 RepID=A0ABD3P135_9STRA|eukprot:CCRYP_018638-RA/>CCRYP_018638-RA protein AED:0.19 eAED:0.19 QI:0/-1/0/1/-1/1/1/0/241
MEHASKRMSIGPKDVLQLKRPTNGFLCSQSEDRHGIEFLRFSITDESNKRVFFAIDNESRLNDQMELDTESYSNDDCYRSIKYTFCADILHLPVVATHLTFKVGDQAINSFRMIERHYFQNKLIKNYDFSFGFCIPGSVNTWESIYDVPPLSENLIQQMIAHPYQIVSDTFYFVGDELIIHNKSKYRYDPQDVGLVVAEIGARRKQRRGSVIPQVELNFQKLRELSIMERGMSTDQISEDL